ncbi:MAG: SDR family NAD(P)-dependent oxidoreductase [Pseudomonadota bacterium]
MSRFSGKICVVTGGGAGIGRALCIALAERGARGVIAADIDVDGAQETARLARAKGADAMATLLDVSDPDAFAQTVDAVTSQFGVVHQLYNNAGVGQGGQTFLETEADYAKQVIDINLMGVLHGTRAFLPHLMASGDGHLVNISSINGIMAQGEGAIYALTKFGVRGFTEAVRVEMLLGDHPVRVVVVHPGGVRTQIASAARSLGADLSPEMAARADRRERIYNEQLLTTPPEKAVAELLDGIERGRSRIVLTPKAKRLDWMVRLLPETYPKMVANWQRKTFQ